MIFIITLKSDNKAIQSKNTEHIIVEGDELSGENNIAYIKKNNKKIACFNIDQLLSIEPQKL